MEYKEILENARTCSGPYCKVCPVCNGKACGNTVPGPGAKGPGSGFVRNYEKWQSVCVNMDTICENKPCDTTLELFGKTWRYPFFAAPVGAMKLHYGDKYDDLAYNQILVKACADAGIAAFTGDGVNSAVMKPNHITKFIRASNSAKNAAYAKVIFVEISKPLYLRFSVSMTLIKFLLRRKK